MSKTIALLAVSALLVLGVARAEPPPAEKPGVTRPSQAKPAQKPQATSSRDKAGATGYHGNDGEEPTQERPNPLRFQQSQQPQALGRQGNVSMEEEEEPMQSRPSPMRGQAGQRAAPLQEPAGATQRAPAR